MRIRLLDVRDHIPSKMHLRQYRRNTDSESAKHKVTLRIPSPFSFKTKGEPVGPPLLLTRIVFVASRLSALVLRGVIDYVPMPRF